MTPHHVKVFYMRPSFFHDGLTWKTPGQVGLTLTQSHAELLTQIVYSDSLERDAILEEVFHKMQGENWAAEHPQTGPESARALLQERGLEHTSMSTGDVLELDGKFYITASFGFDELHPATWTKVQKGEAL